MGSIDSKDICLAVLCSTQIGVCTATKNSSPKLDYNSYRYILHVEALLKDDQLLSCSYFYRYLKRNPCRLVARPLSLYLYSCSALLLPQEYESAHSDHVVDVLLRHADIGLIIFGGIPFVGKRPSSILIPIIL